MARRDDYVSFNQYEDALASLELVALVAPLVRDKPQYWKWVIVGAHNALQGAMVCAYADSTGTSVLEKKSAKKMEKAGLPRIIRAALDAAEELMRRYYVIGHMDDNQQKRLTDALANGRKHLPLRRRPRSRR
jgi:hypothetical protein